MLDFSWSVGKNSIQIKNSYQVSKVLFDYVLDRIESENPDHPIFKRSLWSLKMEWAVHNFCYKIGYEKERTRDIDFEYPVETKYKIAYIILGPISWLLIN